VILGCFCFIGSAQEEAGLGCQNLLHLMREVSRAPGGYQVQGGVSDGRNTDLEGQWQS